MSKKRKGHAQSGQPKKRPKLPVTPDSIPYMIENQKPMRMTQNRQKSETDEMGKGQTQNALETAPESHTKQSEGTSRVDIGPAHQKALKKLPIEEQLDQASEALLLDILEGRDIAQSGSTGKRYKAPANLATRTKASELWLSRRRPQLSAQAVRAEIKTDGRAENLSSRQIAQSIMRTLRIAEVEQAIEADRSEPKKLAAPTGAVAGEAGCCDGPLPPSKPQEPIDPKHGEKVEAGGTPRSGGPGSLYKSVSTSTPEN